MAARPQLHRPAAGDARGAGCLPPVAAGGGDAMSAVEAARAALQDAARGDALVRQRVRGKLTARERIAMLLDAGSFLEVGGFATAQPDGEAGRRPAAPRG